MGQVDRIRGLTGERDRSNDERTRSFIRSGCFMEVEWSQYLACGSSGRSQPSS